jgi:spermidine synthase
MNWYFVFFFVSGFCSILYEIIWLRQAMAQFGVTSPLVSIVLSAFMAGLGLGSWVSGSLIRKYGSRLRIPPLRLYALAELLIGCSAIAVPHQLHWGRKLLEHTSISSSWSYYLGSGTFIALTLVPWCACMGATIPLGMWAIKNGSSREAQRSFSLLYLANVLGAVAGATLPLLMIELRGFRETLKFAAALNVLLAASAVALTLLSTGQTDSAPSDASNAALPSPRRKGRRRSLFLLFLTGLTSMGAEVVWIRQFTPYLSTVVYAFATILGVYLASTFAGSRLYRYWVQTHEREGTWVWSLLGLTTLLPVATASPQLHPAAYYVHDLLRVVIGIAPFSALLGFVTPMLIDRWSSGDPDLAGRAYAVNVVGCILGPLIAGFMLLPTIGERWVLLVFAFPWLLIGAVQGWAAGYNQVAPKAFARIFSYGSVLAALILVSAVQDYGDQFPNHVMLRDNTATVVATGTGMEKRLLVNGIGITYLTPMTKLMAHLPLAFLGHAPRNAMVVCFGMGTTYRSLMSWNIPVTAVELVPSVPRLFPYFHPDGLQLMRSPQSHVVIDDGRRYLERTAQQYDVITIDPPPPVEAAGTSLLYSREFYETIKQRLAPGGILQQWLPRGDAIIQSAVAGALQESFPYVRVFHSFDNRGFHFLASSQPIVRRTAMELTRRLPNKAAEDFLEWGPESSVAGQFSEVLGREVAIDSMISGAPGTPALQDDRPENEYYLLRTPRVRNWLSALGLAP